MDTLETHGHVLLIYDVTTLETHGHVLLIYDVTDPTQTAGTRYFMQEVRI
jgi:hypothetical protein